MEQPPLFLVIDLFCGAGGTTTGFEMTNGLAKVIACVNHDAVAIESHWINHPGVKHFEEDIRTLDLNPLRKVLDNAMAMFPNAYVILWASLECTNFSKAKGGLPRDADSRILAEHLYRYIDTLNPDYIMIENVVEFMAWGPLDENGKPISMSKGCDFVKWKKHINTQYGYRDEWAQLNSADFGAYTSRNRLFGCFAKNGLPIVFPAKQFDKKGADGLPKWKAVKEILRLEEMGESIFLRKKPLVEKTLERIYAGLEKFISQPFVSNYKSGNPKSKNSSIDNPLGTLTTVPTQAVVQPQYLLKYNSMNKNGKYVAPGIDDPSPVVSTQGRLNLVSCNFISTYYKHGSNVSTDNPAHTLTTKDRLSLCTANFIYRDFKSTTNSSIESPAGALVTVPKMNLVSIPFILNPQFSNTGNSIDNPCPTIIASQNKRPLYLVNIAMSRHCIFTYTSDSPMMAKIKQFMRIHGVADIKMRMLFVDELKEIQGFPKNYVLIGSKDKQKKHIGNSVVPIVVKVWVESLSLLLTKQINKIG